MRTLHLAALAISLLFFACGEKGATAFDAAGQEWEFSLSNPPPIMKNLSVPEGTPIAARLRREVFQPGDVIRVEGDSILVESDYRTRFTQFSRKYPLLTANEIPDTLVGFRLSEGIGTTVNAALYKGDSLMGEWLFEEKKERFKEIAYGELTGQTFRCAFPEGDTMQVYFGTSTFTFGRNEPKEYEYYVDELPGFRKERSYVEKGRGRYWGDRMTAMRDKNIYFFFGKGGFSSKRYSFGKNEEENATETDFADRINSGFVIADDTYPSVDSANVSYLYQRDYKGIEYDELSELEFSAEAGGEFLVVVRDRLIWNRKWRLSPDGRYLIVLRKNGDEYGHYPILAYTNEYIDLRMPFTVKTREPRGVELESYAGIDVYIRLARRSDATSR